eukprot:gene35480-43745_t
MRPLLQITGSNNPAESGRCDHGEGTAGRQCGNSVSCFQGRRIDGGRDTRAGTWASTVRISGSLTAPTCRSTQILRLLISAAMRAPKLAIALALLVLAALAATFTYTGFLVVGVLADYLGTGRVLAGLLLGALFARFPWVIKGKLRIVGLLPKPVRRPLVMAILALCLLNFLWRGDDVPALFTGLVAAFLLAYPWLRRAILDRILSSVFKFTGRNPGNGSDDKVIDGEFREKK